MAGVAGVITSPANPRLKLVRRLASRRQRNRLGLFVAEGEDLVAAALDQGIEPEVALLDAERPALDGRLPEAEAVAPQLLAKVSRLGHHARVVAVFRRADLPLQPGSGAGVALWRVADPGNVGTLLRSVDAFAAGFLALSDGCADPTGPKALRASAGAIFRVPVIAFEDSPRPWIALATRGGAPLTEAQLPAGATFVLGAEREGLPEDLVGRSDLALSIPQHGEAESLNVGMAGAVALYEWRRQHP
jgi:RNA methyltransferase, TrmH family